MPEVLPLPAATPFLLSAAKITAFQRCRRRSRLEDSWLPARWHPKRLFDACLRQGLFDLTRGETSNKVVKEAEQRFIAGATAPGLDIRLTEDVYSYAMSWVGMLEAILTAMSRREMLVLQDRLPELLSSNLAWSFASHIDDLGSLHRWVTVDSWDDDAATRELHSWFSFGEVAAADTLLNLHVIEIGQLRAGRRHSPWGRAYQHPAVSIRKFQRTGNRSLQGQWNPVYYVDLRDNRDNTPDSWVDHMEREGVVDTLIHDVVIKPPAPADRKRFIQDSKEFALAIQAVSTTDPLHLPMARPACDSGVPCPFISLCYNSAGLDPGTLGYRRKDRRAAAASSN